jgi:[acyl-carrier-protein] S-malonyltransferase
MDAARLGQPQAMLAVRGPADRLEVSAKRCGLEIAIRIAPNHLIVAGPAAEVMAARLAFDRAGLETREVPVRIASHTRAMADAVPCFASRLRENAWRRPAIPVVCGLDGIATRDAARLGAALSAQLARTVRWDLCMQTIAERGVRRVLEVGSGQALARLWNACHPEVPARAIGEFANWPDALTWACA